VPDRSAHILYCVLNWGLGHATRSIPVIKALLAAGYTVDIASDGGPLAFLQKTFPDCRSFELPGYAITYPTRLVFLNAATQLRNVFRGITAEHTFIEQLFTKHKYSAIVSDNRYGCYSHTVPSVLITHQIRNLARTAVLSMLAERLVDGYLVNFDEIWVPDTPDRRLSGKLTDFRSEKVRFIGHLSDQIPAPQQHVYDIAAILSGPEPQRTRLEEELLPQLVAYSGKSVLVRGLIQDIPPGKESNVLIYSYRDRAGINTLLNTSSMIICRSGYSSLMDLVRVGTKALLIPTPGQPEQVYLGERLKNHLQFVVQQQGKVDVHAAQQELSARGAPKQTTFEVNLLPDALTALERLIEK